MCKSVCGDGRYPLHSGLVFLSIQYCRNKTLAHVSSLFFLFLGALGPHLLRPSSSSSRPWCLRPPSSPQQQAPGGDLIGDLLSIDMGDSGHGGIGGMGGMEAWGVWEAWVVWVAWVVWGVWGGMGTAQPENTGAVDLLGDGMESLVRTKCQGVPSPTQLPPPPPPLHCWPICTMSILSILMREGYVPTPFPKLHD